MRTKSRNNFIIYSLYTGIILFSINANASPSTAIQSTRSDGTITNNSSLTSGDQIGIIINSGDTNNIVDNNGSITANDATTILNEADGTTINNRGLLHGNGNNSVEESSTMISSGSNLTLNNFGSIIATGTLAAAVEISGDDFIINNSGSIKNANGVAIATFANNGNIILNEGSLIIGNITTTGTNNTLTLNLGSGKSYAYTTSGEWNLIDLDNRPVIKGSAIAAGIGIQETADEMLHFKNSLVENSLEKRKENNITSQKDNNGHEIWLDPYAAKQTREADSSEPTMNKYTSSIRGITVGTKLNSDKKIDAIVNISQNDLNIDQGSQKLQSQSIEVGLLASDLADYNNLKISGKLLLGYTDNDATRTVLTNTSDTGSSLVTANYNSYDFLVGPNAHYNYRLNQKNILNLNAGLDLALQHTGSYNESAYFSWKDRTLTETSGNFDIGITHNQNESLSFWSKIGVDARTVLSGKASHYKAENTEVSFSRGNFNDTNFFAQIGANYNIESYLSSYISLAAGKSLNNVTTKQGNVGMKVNF